MRIRLLISGSPPRTKKNSLRQIRPGRRGRIIPIPSKAWTEWVRTSLVELISGATGLPVPDRPYNCRAHFYRDAERGDAIGFYQGLADLLEKRGVITNDKWLVSWDGSRLFKDKDNPRVEVTLETD